MVPFTAAGIAALQKLTEPLDRVVRLHTEFYNLGGKRTIALRRLDQVACAKASDNPCQGVRLRCRRVGKN
jgi:hypothetical protein